MVSPVRGYLRRYQAETPLIGLFKFARPALGAREYDRFFIGFECGHIQGKTAHVFARSEHNAHQIGSRYSTHVAIAVESVIKRPIKTVHVLPRHFSDSRPEI
jgi:hypothetical protein